MNKNAQGARSPPPERRITRSKENLKSQPHV